MIIRYLANRAANAMERSVNYDATYLREVAATSEGAALRLGLLPQLSQYRDGAPIDLWAGAAVASTRDGDCGPCLQLVVDMATNQGANAGALEQALKGNWSAAGQTGLGFRFAEAAISGNGELDALRDEIEHEFGKRAVVSLSISSATARCWPVIKRGLGHGKVCQAVKIGDSVVNLKTEENEPLE